MAPEGETHNGHGVLTRGNGLPIDTDGLRQKLDDARIEVVAFVKKHPVECLTGAVVAGFFLGRLAARRW